jgi:hypothetical protein
MLWKGVVIWSVTLIVLYRAAPRLAPHRSVLARVAIGFLALILPLGFYNALSHRPPMGYDPNQGPLVTSLGVVAGGGFFVALICGAFVMFGEARHSS